MAVSVTGANARLCLKEETVFGTAPTGNYVGVPFNSLDLLDVDETADDIVLGLGNDPQRPTREGVSVRGKLSAPIDTVLAGYYLKGLFGAATVSGAGPYVHTFKSAGKVLPSFALEVQHTDAASPLFHGFTGCMFGSATLMFDDKGRPHIELNIVGKDGAESGTSIASTPTFADPVYYHQSLNLISLGGSPLDKASTYNLTLDRSLEPLKYIGGGGKVGEILLNIAKYEGELTARYGDSVLANHGKAADVLDLLVGWQIDTATYLKFDFPATELLRKGRSISGGGSIARTYACKSSKGAGATTAVVATLGTTTALY